MTIIEANPRVGQNSARAGLIINNNESNCEPKHAKNTSMLPEPSQQKKKTRRGRRGQISRNARKNRPCGRVGNGDVIQTNVKDEAALSEGFLRLRMSARSADDFLRPVQQLTGNSSQIRHKIAKEQHLQRQQNRENLLDKRRYQPKANEESTAMETVLILHVTEMFGKLSISEKTQKQKTDRGSTKRQLSIRYQREEGPTEPKRFCL